MDIRSSNSMSALQLTKIPLTRILCNIFLTDNTHTDGQTDRQNVDNNTIVGLHTQKSTLLTSSGSRTVAYSVTLTRSHGTEIRQRCPVHFWLHGCEWFCLLQKHERFLSVLGILILIKSRWVFEFTAAAKNNNALHLYCGIPI